MSFLRGRIFSIVLDTQQGNLRGRSPNSSTVYPWNKCVAEVFSSRKRWKALLQLEEGSGVVHYVGCSESDVVIVGASETADEMQKGNLPSQYSEQTST